MNVPSRVGPNRDNLLKRQREIISGANELGKRAHDNGVVTSFHPISPANSYFRFEEDYTFLLEELDARYMGYTPDVGHIIFGEMKPIDIIRKYLPIIKHVHFKDATISSEWKKMGHGDIDFPEIVKTLKDYGYKNWIIVEEETQEAATNSDQVILDIGDYVNNNLKQIVKGV